MNRKDENPVLLNSTEVAEILGKSRQEVLRLARAGRLKCKKIGREYVFWKPVKVLPPAYYRLRYK